MNISKLTIAGSALIALTLGCRSSEPQPASNTVSTKTTKQVTAKPASTKAPQAKAPPPDQPVSKRPAMTPGADGLSWRAHSYPRDGAGAVVRIERGLPAEVAGGGEFDYAIRVTNMANYTLHDVVVSDELSKGMSLKSSEPSGTLGAVSKWNLGDLHQGESKVIRARGAVTGNADEVGGCASLTYNEKLCASVPVVRPKLKLEKIGPAEVLKCDEFTYTFRATNEGTGVVRGVILEDQLPEGLLTTKGKSSVRLNMGDLAAGKTKSANVRVKATKAGSFANKATASSSSSGINASSNTVTTRVSEPRLELAIKCRDKAFIGKSVCYSFTVDNKGNGIAKDAIIELALPSGLRLSKVTDGGQKSGSGVKWKVGDLAPGASKKVSLCLSPTKQGTVELRARTKARCADTVSKSCSTEFVGIPAILLEVIDVEDPIPVGEIEEYEIVATNQGSADGTNIKIEILLEDTMKFEKAEGATKATVSGNKVTFEALPALSPKKTATWKVFVKAVSQGDVRFGVQMTSDQLKRPVNETESTNFYE